MDTIRYAAAHANFLYKLGMANLWMFSGLISNIMGSDPTTDASQRTTTSPTILDAGVKSNVVPGEAFATINHRIHPADRLEDVLRHYEAVLGGDDRIEITTEDYMEPFPVSPYDNGDATFQILCNSALEVYPDAAVIPGLMIANTDAKHYEPLSDRVYRFSPTFLVGDELNMFHGLDEKISLQNYRQVVQFYYRLIRNAAYEIVPK